MIKDNMEIKIIVTEMVPPNHMMVSPDVAEILKQWVAKINKGECGLDMSSAQIKKERK